MQGVCEHKAWLWWGLYIGYLGLRHIFVNIVVRFIFGFVCFALGKPCCHGIFQHLALCSQLLLNRVTLAAEQGQSHSSCNLPQR